MIDLNRRFLESCYRDLNSGPLPYQGSALPLSYNSEFRAENGAQTRDPQLGRLVLYQLSYFRVKLFLLEVGGDGFEPPKSKDNRFTVCPIWPLWKPPKFCSRPPSGASCRIRTNDPEITNHVLWPTELKRRVPVPNFRCMDILWEFAGAKVHIKF